MIFFYVFNNCAGNVLTYIPSSKIIHFKLLYFKMRGRDIFISFDWKITDRKSKTILYTKQQYEKAATASKSYKPKVLIEAI